MITVVMQIDAPVNINVAMDGTMEVHKEPIRVRACIAWTKQRIDAGLLPEIESFRSEEIQWHPTRMAAVAFGTVVLNQSESEQLQLLIERVERRISAELTASEGKPIDQQHVSAPDRPAC